MQYFQAKIRSSGTNQPEWRANMHFHDHIERVIGHCVQHLVVSETGCFVVNRHSRTMTVKIIPLFTMWFNFPYLLYDICVR